MELLSFSVWPILLLMLFASLSAAQGLASKSSEYYTSSFSSFSFIFRLLNLHALLSILTIFLLFSSLLDVVVVVAVIIIIIAVGGKQTLRHSLDTVLSHIKPFRLLAD
jgi:hypothetical protein